MTRMQKSFIAAAAAASIGIAALGVGTTFAAEKAAVPNAQIHSLVTAIAEKFHLSESDVQAVFDAQHQKMMADAKANMLKHEADRISQAVSSGKITQAQADLIKAKETEIQTFMETLKDKTPAERNAAVKAQADALKTWETANNIPANFFFFPGFNGAHGFHGMRPHAPNGQD